MCETEKYRFAEKLSPCGRGGYGAKDVVSDAGRRRVKAGITVGRTHIKFLPFELTPIISSSFLNS